MGYTNSATKLKWWSTYSTPKRQAQPWRSTDGFEEGDCSNQLTQTRRIVDDRQ
ncbi:unnamed protein product, partial [Strongylus vulgaris]